MVQDQNALTTDMTLVPTAPSDCSQAMIDMDASHSVIRSLSSEVFVQSVDHLSHISSARSCLEQKQQRQRSIEGSLHNSNSSSNNVDPPDLFQEDECDVGPRVLQTPVLMEEAPLHPTLQAAFVNSLALFNQAVSLHSDSKLVETKQIYQMLVQNVQQFLLSGVRSRTLLELGMRVHNNLGQIIYKESNESVALTYFEAALTFGKPLSDMLSASAYQLEYATILSNKCRVYWLQDDTSEELCTGLQEVLRIRTCYLSSDHHDVAAAHFNLAVVEHARTSYQTATAHFQQYLDIASATADKSSPPKNTADSNNCIMDGLDQIPALTYILLMKNDDEGSSASQELVRGLRTLQDKRQDHGPESSEVASILNLVGALLFREEDYSNSLVFFQEELRIEERLSNSGKNDISVSVTCNNIGRILQELGKSHKAIYYYKRALRNEVGDDMYSKSWNAMKTCLLEQPSNTAGEDITTRALSKANLYSTVWYNLGLIHDKIGLFDEAICSFQMSLELRMKMLGRNHPDIVCLMYNIGVLQMEQKQLIEASTSFRDALQIRRSVGGAGQLDDLQVINTLEKLTSLYRAQGNTKGALEVSREVLLIVKTSKHYDHISRAKALGATLRSIAELHHAAGDLNEAITIAMESSQKLKSVYICFHLRHFDVEGDEKKQLLDISVELASSVLLLGSLYHEICEPLIALSILQEAAEMIHHATERQGSRISKPSNFMALREMADMLTHSQCAPQA